VTSPGPSWSEIRLRPPDPRWDAPVRPDSNQVDELAGALRLPRALCSVLVARGHTAPDAAKRFLRPRLDHLHDPSLLADGPRAAERIARATRGNERILVHGDYDVDGVCATALLTRWFRSLGADVVPFVPHRLRDGYDFSSAGLAAAREAGAGLIVTVDCGTVAHDAIAAARDAGIDVVVTDHHTVPDSLPDAFAVVNPQRSDCAYPEKRLCGAGLAYKVSELVGAELGADLDELAGYLDLVALATVADLVPLSGENRVLVQYGLRRLPHTRIPGVRALLQVATVDPSQVTAGQIGYVVAPRINAAGRIGESADALRLLLTESADEASTLAAELDATNTRRRDEGRKTLDEALDALSGEYDPQRDYGVVLAGEGWHAGVIGIVASRVVERIHRPVVMISLDEEGGRGSARSIPGFHLYEAIAECSAHLERFGGHRQAAGMDLRREAVPRFREAFNEAARVRLASDDLRPVLHPDIDIRLCDIDLQLTHWLGYLEPHGIGNPSPLFRARKIGLEGPRVVGANHLKVTLEQSGDRLEAIGFGLADRFPVETLGGGRYDALFRLERNEWRGRARPQAKLAELRPSVGDS
jgi:single-stranded-DNA-specific exonuclease